VAGLVARWGLARSARVRRCLARVSAALRRSLLLISALLLWWILLLLMSTLLLWGVLLLLRMSTLLRRVALWWLLLKLAGRGSLVVLSYIDRVSLCLSCSSYVDMRTWRWTIVLLPAVLWLLAELAAGASGTPETSLRSSACLLVFLIIAGIDGAKQKLNNPEIGREIDRWLRTHHLLLLVLEVARAVNHRPDRRVFVELAEELPRHLVVSNLSKFEGECTLSVLRARDGVKCLTDRIENGILGFTGRLAVCHRNDQHWLAKLVGLNLGHDDIVNNFSLQRGSHWRETGHTLAEALQAVIFKGASYPLNCTPRIRFSI